MQNEVTMEAVQVTSDEGIDSITPMKRGCLFSYEQPENYTLKGHKKYTQVIWKYKALPLNDGQPSSQAVPGQAIKSAVA